MWLLQFTNEKKERSYRLIVLSRNISYDRCYDISLVLESFTERRGKGATERSFKKTRAILDYLLYLKTVSEISQEQLKIIDELIKDMENEQVGFSIDNPIFDEDDWDIYPFYENTLDIDGNGNPGRMEAATAAENERHKSFRVLPSSARKTGTFCEGGIVHAAWLCLKREKSGGVCPADPLSGLPVSCLRFRPG